MPVAADQSERIITVVLACREYPTGFFYRIDSASAAGSPPRCCARSFFVPGMP